ncbi:Linoleate 10R-lipoxygenase COP4 [Neolecta irregularis DAH-3]|uniref:Terpene synthase n=1 Tax=Neolecta irregularis (strain DAH-3) TaxID=1198029 RepID=A0A1U7LI22_NEOID|nr:Linoleate 10R-lipoxygenase COP4 [Neolecta irregularis DAH-3]|eukprot:OLL22306.1 Linoleate 10R-lipoxygenase COP4 [Neolecta irregularis DAH-3]
MFNWSFLQYTFSTILSVFARIFVNHRQQYDDYYIKDIDGRQVLEKIHITKPRWNGSRRAPLTFLSTIHDKFFDDCIYKREASFDKEVIGAVREMATTAGILDLNDKRSVAAFQAFCPAALLFYPQASVQTMISALSFLNLLWFVDDKLDDEHLLTSEEASSLVSCVATTFMKELPAKRNLRWPEVQKYALAVRDRLLLHRDEAWVEHFGKTYKSYAEASMIETNMIRQNSSISIADYIDLRMETSGVYPCQELMAIVYDFNLDDSPEISRARLLGNRFISFSNDIFSFEKEFNSNSMNLVKLHMHKNRCTLNESLEYAISLLNNAAAEIEEIGHQVETQEEWKKIAILSLKKMIQGCGIFSRTSRRYCTPSSPFWDVREQFKLLEKA